MKCFARPLSMVVVMVVAIAGQSGAGAAPAWIYRSLTLPRGDVALDVGLGLGHQPPFAPNRPQTGLGMNLEIAAGITHELELGFRTGIRFDSAGQDTRADRYGRPFETETYGTFNDRVANPEVRMRWTVARGNVAQLGMDLRAYLPFENGSRFGLMFGVPLMLRLGSVRIDTGLFVPVLFDPTASVISIPIHLWIQATQSLWLGPMFGVRIFNNGGNSYSEYPLGFGIGTMLDHGIDLRAWFLFPQINGNAAARTFGTGLALQIRFE